MTNGDKGTSPGEMGTEDVKYCALKVVYLSLLLSSSHIHYHNSITTRTQSLHDHTTTPNLLPLPPIWRRHSPTTYPPTLHIPLSRTPRCSPILRKIVVAKVPFFEIIPALAKRFLLAVGSSLSI